MESDLKELRENMKRQRRQMDEKSKKEKSHVVCQKLIQECSCCNVLGFYPLENEVSPLEFYEYHLSNNGKLFLPVTKKGEIQFFQVSSLEELKEGAFHIMEPSDLSRPYLGEEAIAIIPGLAFDRQHNRIGYGGGYYDRFLSKNPQVTKWAVAYREQMVDHLSPQKWDVKMDRIFID